MKKAASCDRGGLGGSGGRSAPPGRGHRRLLASASQSPWGGAIGKPYLGDHLAETTLRYRVDCTSSRFLRTHSSPYSPCRSYSRNRGAQTTGGRLQKENDDGHDHSYQKPQASTRNPTDLGAEASRDIAAALAALLADVFTLYIKTKNFHWHVSGPHFRTITRYWTSRVLKSLR